MRRLDIGIASYGRNHQQLKRTLDLLIRNSRTDWRCVIVHNPSPGDEQTKETISHYCDTHANIACVWLPTNVGYAGAVNAILQYGSSEYLAYLDNDAEITTQGWDETLCGYLDRFHEIGMIFPGGGAYQIDRGAYTEVQWGVGFCWVLSRLCMSETGLFDDKIGHQNECDYAMRVRMAGYKCAAAPEVSVQHMATSTNDPASNERIAKGVREFVDKWCKYFCGKNVNYHSANVLRWEDWPPNALYMEEYWKTKTAICGLPDGHIEMSGLNASPQVVTLDGREYDLIRVPRFKDFYRGRII